MLEQQNKEEWWYLENKKICGPLSRLKMREYYLSLTFQQRTNLKVSLDPDKEFLNIEKFYPDPVNTLFIPPIVPKEQENEDIVKVWYFLDSKRKAQGPFSTAEMREWFPQYFDGSLYIFNTEDATRKNWMKVKDYFPDYKTTPPFAKVKKNKTKLSRVRRKKPSRRKKKKKEVILSEDFDVPTPPPFKNIFKVFPSQAEHELQPLKITDVFGQSV